MLLPKFSSQQRTSIYFNYFEADPALQNYSDSASQQPGKEKDYSNSLLR